METDISQILNSQKKSLASPYHDQVIRDEEKDCCPVPAAPRCDFLHSTQLDPFLDFQPSQIFRSSQYGNSTQSKHPKMEEVIFGTPEEKTPNTSRLQLSQRRQLFKLPTKTSSTQLNGGDIVSFHNNNNQGDNSRVQQMSQSDKEFTSNQRENNIQIVTPSAIPSLKKNYYTPSPLVLNQGNVAGVKLKSVDEIAEKYRSVFRFPFFNIIQSKVFDEVFYKDNPLVVCAPTGAGKTVVFELAIIRLLMKMEQMSFNTNFKIVYMAPIKALCSERCSDWSDKFGCFGLKCQELTGDSEQDDYYHIQQVNIICTTPEKWDSMTRRWRDNKFIVQSICLFFIDEIHVLSDATRGATMEAVISRMKTIQAARIRAVEGVGQTIPKLRFVAVSATIPNIKDIAEWLGDKMPAVHFNMDDSFRPVRLRKVVLGSPFDENKGSDFQFDMSLNYRLPRIINTYSENKPTLVFCSTRKSTQQAAEILLRDNGSTYVRTYFQKEALRTCANSLKDNKLRDLVARGVGYHHAGLDVHDRKAIEEIFLEGQLMVLVATSTLAMGVNLPAHLVILKSTSYYNLGVHVEYSDTQILQMIGRAGRPQFDTTATAVIMTKNHTKDKYESLVNGTQLIESSLHKNLIEHLNAEIVLHTINDISIAMEWIRYTFLYIRVMKNPKNYGMPVGLNKEQIEKRLQELCMKNLNLLNTYGMITMDEETIEVKPTEPGKLMARYCIAFETMKKFSKLGPTETISELLYELSGCEEFTEVQLRNNEKKTLNTFNRDKNRVTVRYPLTGKVKTKQMKVNILIQVGLGCLLLQDFSLQQDTTRIFRAAQRVSRCLVELLWLKADYKSLLSAVQLMKCLKARLWEDSKYISKQLDGIGPALSNALVNAGITTFQKILESNPRELELIVNRHPPFGNQLRDLVSCLPKYELTIEQVSKYHENLADIVIHLVISNPKQLGIRKTLPENHTCVLLIGDEDNKVIYKRKIMDVLLLKEHGITKKLEIKRAAKGPELFINLISQEWVGLDVQITYTPYYIGAKKVSNISNAVESVPKCQVDNQKGTSSCTDVRKACGHRCLNKSLCGHECCRNGVTKQRPSKTTSKTHVVSKPKLMDSYISNVKSRVPETPNHAKRLKMSGSTNLGPKLDLNKFAYQPQTKRMPSIHNSEIDETIVSEVEGRTLLDLECVHPNTPHEQLANRNVPFSPSEDWADLDMYMKHQYSVDDELSDLEDQSCNIGVEAEFERSQEKALDDHMLPYIPATPRFGQVVAWSNNKDNIRPSSIANEKDEKQKCTQALWGLNQDTLAALTTSNRNSNTGYFNQEAWRNTREHQNDFPNMDNHPADPNQTKCINRQIDISNSENIDIPYEGYSHTNRRTESLPQTELLYKNQWTSRNVLENQQQLEKQKTCPETMTNETTDDWSGSESDFITVDDPDSRRSFYGDSAADQRNFATISPEDEFCQDSLSPRTRCCGKSEKLRKAEHEMEQFLFGSIGHSKDLYLEKEDDNSDKREHQKSWVINHKAKSNPQENIQIKNMQPIKSDDCMADEMVYLPKTRSLTNSTPIRRGTFSSIFDNLF
ncbi:probable ATP-dependent DNA helicase HFM1 [Saccostrea echinata]|uniref:probable ATP-dependent DNA helicase HFM1 n=1 Tax=Saccostrea echinata TaxID=191078 RepID=UPI002A805F3B|nr:probable ATP-dependent DNA helicase HFM1 [Saccostrea echinata]